MDISIFKKLGLNEKDIKVFLALLENGATSVRGVATLTGLNRGTVYDTLKKLQEIGVVSFFHKESKQRFIAEDPDALIKLIQIKEAEIKTTKEKLNSLMPELKSLQEKGGKKPVTKFYEGSRGIRLILEDLLDTMKESIEKEYYVYSAKDASDDIKKAYPDFTKDRIQENINVRSISLAEGGGTHGLDDRRWLGTHDESATFILIYDEKCAFISRDAQNNPVGVLIENEMIYKTQMVIFLQLWDLLK